MACCLQGHLFEQELRSGIDFFISPHQNYGIRCRVRQMLELLNVIYKLIFLRKLFINFIFSLHCLYIIQVFIDIY